MKTRRPLQTMTPSYGGTAEYDRASKWPTPGAGPAKYGSGKLGKAPAPGAPPCVGGLGFLRGRNLAPLQPRPDHERVHRSLDVTLGLRRGGWQWLWRAGVLRQHARVHGERVRLYGEVWHKAVNEHRRGGDCVTSETDDRLASQYRGLVGIGVRGVGFLGGVWRANERPASTACAPPLALCLSRSVTQWVCVSLCRNNRAACRGAEQACSCSEPCQRLNAAQCMM
ncbi:hypothetical protein SFRURICE_001594 [Spodoptera frugiperda]|nr:hypothetical protein SFRURICE_001594 [Spodoptera frugiperda]